MTTTVADIQEDNEQAEVLQGLTADQKNVSPKYFYDAKGSALFDAICKLPEYYPTRTEVGIMQAYVDEMVECVGPEAAVIEYGSGASTKTRLLLDHLDDPVAYMPVDISCEYLHNVAAQLAADYVDIEVLPVCADFTKPLSLPAPRREPVRNVVYFPGSTIGNFSNSDAIRLLRQMRGDAQSDGGLLIGVDLVKSREVLELAYNDPAGVTAEFNLNLLRNLNREFGSDFDTDKFRHEAIYDDEHQRIEMRLISLQRQTVRLNGCNIEFEPGEYIVTEHSHKYSYESFAELAADGGFTVSDTWTDPDELFSVQYLEAA
ncbi:MAG: L-histidine N(alpha)-methyltransferase [Gammaproteobacteria bacterium]|nr:L-histidine N(alpha)-methyltransferase [Gammaproteobacteria bacterium]